MIGILCQGLKLLPHEKQCEDGNIMLSSFGMRKIKMLGINSGINAVFCRDLIDIMFKPYPKKNISHNRLFGFQDRMINYKPVRWPEQQVWTHIMDAHQGKVEKFIEIFEKTAIECIRDGADTILVPGYPFGAALSMAGYTEVSGTGVSIIDGAAAALKLAETLTDLHKSTGLTTTRSQMSQYQEPPNGLVSQP